MKRQADDFRITLHQEDVLFFEGVLKLEQFHPLTKTSVDIRLILPKIINQIQTELSKEWYDTNYEGYNLLGHYKDELKKYNQKSNWTIPYYNPQKSTSELGGRISSGVEFTFGFYIGENLIVERVFYIDNFNKVSRWSLDVKYLFDDIKDMIISHLKDKDRNNIWDDYHIMTKHDYSYTQIPFLSTYERIKLLK